MDQTTFRLLSGAAVGGPAVITFTADNYYPSWNQTTTLTWNVANSVSQSINHDIGPVAASGSIGRSAYDTTRTYTLTAIGQDGITYTSSIVIYFGPYPTCYWAQYGYPQYC